MWHGWGGGGGGGGIILLASMIKSKEVEQSEAVVYTFFVYREQRRRYHAIRERAETDRSIMSIILDGMDQNSTNLPHLKRVNKTAANLWHLRTHLTGVIIHGHGSYAYMDLLQWPHDPNLTISILIEVLLHRMLNLIENCHLLPKKLFLQMDNCVRENKNQHVMAFLSLLVQEKVFDEVRNYYSLLMLILRWPACL